jgi:hypothetical protein
MEENTGNTDQPIDYIITERGYAAMAAYDATHGTTSMGRNQSSRTWNLKLLMLTNMTREEMVNLYAILRRAILRSNTARIRRDMQVKQDACTAELAETAVWVMRMIDGN